IAGVLRIKRVEYQTVCTTPAPAGHPYRKMNNPMIASPNCPDGEDVCPEVYARIQSEGCLPSCNMTGFRSYAILRRQLSIWENNFDLNGAYLWPDNTNAQIECLPKSLFRPTDDNEGCEF